MNKNIALVSINDDYDIDGTIMRVIAEKYDSSNHRILALLSNDTVHEVSTSSDNTPIIERSVCVGNDDILGVLKFLGFENLGSSKDQIVIVQTVSDLVLACVVSAHLRDGEMILTVQTDKKILNCSRKSGALSRWTVIN